MLFLPPSKCISFSSIKGFIICCLKFGFLLPAPTTTISIPLKLLPKPF
jgi:hypothetical protein